MRFWDSSALIPLVVDERHSAALETLIDDDPDMVVWWTRGVECTSAVHRLRREGTLAAEAAAEIVGRLSAGLAAANEVQPTDTLRATAQRLLAVHPLRAADALQLAAALTWARHAPHGRELVSLDVRLREAALLEGIRVLPQASGPG